MAHVFTGTATNHADLLDKIIVHLTNAAILGTQVWEHIGTTTVSATERQTFLKGPGLAQQDQIYVNILQYENSDADFYNFQLFGAVGYSAAQTVATQAGASPGCTIPLWNAAIPYWLIADGRHFKLITKVSTTYQTGFAGFIMPYATSLEMPYPMYIGGSTSNAGYRWSTAAWHTGSFFDPPATCSYMRNFDGSWIEVKNYQSSASSRIEEITSNVWPWQFYVGLGNNQDGSYGMLPAIIHSSLNGGNVFGELPGVKYISGFNNAAENTITDGADTYLVVQSGYRTGTMDYAAILLG